ncbi:MAG: hypothetical protein ABI045_04790 [Flavobacteriales bacterium]
MYVLFLFRRLLQEKVDVQVKKRKKYFIKSYRYIFTSIPKGQLCLFAGVLAYVAFAKHIEYAVQLQFKQKEV